MFPGLILSYYGLLKWTTVIVLAVGATGVLFVLTFMLPDVAQPNTIEEVAFSLTPTNDAP
jgi:hypothetical protein